MIAQSNNLSQLTASLAGALYDFGGNPFDERILVLPDTHMKQPIFEALTRQTESRVAAGLKVMNLAQALETVSGEKLPTLLELSLFLEARLLRHLNDKAFAPIAQYLEKEVRIAPLCEVMSRIFWDYALFGDAALAPWSQKAGWQQVLWNEVNEAWVLPHRLEVRGKKALYLFGFAYLPPLYLRFFSQAEAQFFFFSPCNVFFADYASDRQKLFLGRQEGFKATLEGQHKLLANLGKLAMSMQASIEDIGGATEEPFTIKEGATLLDAFQRDMTEGEILSSPESDDTIQIFSAPTRLREVEVLKDKLLPLLTGDRPLKPTDILIVAPDIANYAAALKSVFESEEYSIPLVIEGLPVVALDSDANRLQGLFDLVKERFALQPLFQFLEGMPGYTKDELFQMRRFAEEAEVRWGLNSEQRAAFSGAGGSGGTWEESLTRLARSMAFLEGPQVVGQSDWEVAGRLFHLLEEMSRDLKPFWDGLKRSVDVWARYFLAMIEKYIGQNFEAPKELRHLAFGFKEQTPISFESARRW